MLAHVILYVIAVVLGLVGLATLHFGFFADTSQGRPRCPRCWHDMTGSRGFVCPECGHDARTQAALLRTRRDHMKALLGALLLLSGFSLAALPTVQEQGWRALIPTTALMVVVPWTDNPWFLDELDARLTASNPEWFERRARRTDVSDYGRFFAHRCAALLDAPRANELRLRAVQLLSDMKLRDDRCERALLRATTDEDPAIRNESLNALMHLASTDSIVDVDRCSLQAAQCLLDTRVAVRTRAARLLDQLHPLHPDAITALIEALSDERPEVRQEVCVVLADVGPGAIPAVDSLIALIDDPSPRVSANAMLALGAIGVAASPAVDELIGAISDDGRRADAALRALSQLGPAALDAVPSISELLHDAGASARSRYSGVVALFAIDSYHPSVLDALERATTMDVEPARLWIASRIARYRANEPQQVRILLALLGDDSQRVRQEAALSLGRMAPLRPDEIERLAALGESREFIGWEEAQIALARVLEEHYDAPGELPDHPDGIDNNEN